jgi:ATP-dependent helicase/nuclease subunit B
MRFTDQIAEYIHENNMDLKHLTIILPSERAKKYLVASLFRCYQKPLLAPEMITIDQWVRNLTDKTVIDKTRALIKLFDVQNEYLGSKTQESFDEFMTWGNILLNDYDELDRYLLSSEQVFKNLADVKELENWEVENWSFDKKELTDGQKRFMEFWDRLPIYYRKLNERLEKEAICYMGKAYRFVAEHIDVVFAKDNNRHFLFAGFNALSPAELAIMKQLNQMGRGHVLINADRFYFENPNHEAGRFLHNLSNKLALAPIPFSDNLTHGHKTIKVIECAQHTGQIKAITTILNDYDQYDLNDTLILLADERLIAPLLKNLPKKIQKANITLGLPLRDTALRTWVDLIFSIQENKFRFKSEAVYFHDIQKLWNHPFLIALLSEGEKGKLAKLEADFIRRNTIFMHVTSVQTGGITDKVLELITVNWASDWGKGLAMIRSLNQLLFKEFKQEDSFEKAIIQGFDSAVQDFENLVKEGIPTMSLKSFRQLFHQHWSTKSIAYHGNPLEGLQVMGLLETRLLDFKNIFVLGFNEGKMPPTNPIQTMIPMDLRAYFGLPTPRDKQGLFAHHFYRLLHHCENMWITYTSAQESVGSNEASRYLLQLELELARVNPAIAIQRMFYSISNETVETTTYQSIEKTPAIIKRMDELFARSVSASALKKYMTCPLDFYYRYVLDFGEEDKVEEEVESNTFGTFIHHVLEELYEPFARHDKLGKLKKNAPPNITSVDIQKMLTCYEQLITFQFLKHFNQDKKAFSSGKNLLSYHMALELTRRILEQEKRFLERQTEPVFIEYLEAELSTDIALEMNGVTKSLHFKGVIDRIDSVGGKLRIIDYKSGKVNDSDVTFSDVKDESLLIDYFNKGKYVLQLTMYCYLFQQHFGKLPDEASIYSLINISEGPFPLKSKSKQLSEIVAYFPDFITLLFREIYAVEIPFEHKSAGSYNFCAYCD